MAVADIITSRDQRGPDETAAQGLVRRAEYIPGSSDLVHGIARTGDDGMSVTEGGISPNTLFVACSDNRIVLRSAPATNAGDGFDQMELVRLPERNDNLFQRTDAVVVVPGANDCMIKVIITAKPTVFSAMSSRASQPPVLVQLEKSAVRTLRTRPSAKSPYLYENQEFTYFSVEQHTGIWLHPRVPRSLNETDSSSLERSFVECEKYICTTKLGYGYQEWREHFRCSW